MKPLASSSARILFALLPLIVIAPVRAQTRPASAPETLKSVKPTTAALPTKAMASIRTADRFFRDNDPVSAAKHYAVAALAAPDEPLPRLLCGLSLSVARQPKLALNQYRAAFGLASDDLLCALLLQGALSEVGEAAESQQVYLDAMRRFRRDGRSSLDASGSLSRLNAAAIVFPESPAIQLLLGDAFQMEERFDDAGKAYRRAIVLAPQWSRPRVNLGLALLAQNRPGDAIATLGVAVKQDPRNVQAQLAIGEAQNKTGRPREALETYRKLEQIPDVAVIAATGAAQAAVQLGQFADARRFLGNAQRLAPKDPGPIAAMAELHKSDGDFARAAESYAVALRLSQEGGLFSAQPSLFRALAEAQLSAKKPDDAIATTKKALADDPANAPLWRRIQARAHGDKKDFVGEEDSLKAALDSETALYPLETLNAIAERGLIQKFVVSYRADLDGAKTGVRSAGDGGGFALRSVPVSPDGQIVALSALGHLLRFENATRDEVSARRDLCALRGNAIDWLLLAQAQERLKERADARASYARSLSLPGLGAPARRLAEQRLKTLAPIIP